MTTGALLRRAASRSTRILAGEPYTGFLTTDAGGRSAAKDARCYVNVSIRRLVSRGPPPSEPGHPPLAVSYRPLAIGFWLILVLAVSPSRRLTKRPPPRHRRHASTPFRPGPV